MATDNSIPSTSLLQLQAGPLALQFDPELGFIRYMQVNGRELLRGVYVAVRDRNWGTVPPLMSGLHLEQSEQGFELRFTADCRQNEIHFVWQGTITGNATGEVRYHMRGEAKTGFLRNRIGFCVLHPMDAAGVPCLVEHADGSTEESRFPDAISPHQPFFELQAISHEVQPGLWTEVRFEGDVFEMEDQRNWTDASFKTYCTPLGLPFPVEVPAGTVVEQSVTVKLLSEVPVTAGQAEDAEVITFHMDEGRQLSLPALGLGLATHGQALTAQEITRLRQLHPSHLRVDLHLSGEYEAEWQRALAETAALGCGLEVALFVSDAAEKELASFARTVQGAPVVRWIIFHEKEKSTRHHWVEIARRTLEPVSEAPIGAGANAYFTELNRERPPVEVLDFVTFSLNPTVHADDDLSLVETLEAQAEVVRNAAQFSGLPVVVSPVTLRPRFNPNATGPEPPPAPGELPSQVDARQSTLFGAAWTLGSIKHLAQGGAHSVTFYETTGWRGVLETAAGSPVEKFVSIPGAVFPLYHVLADIEEYATPAAAQHEPEVCLRPCRSSAPLKVEGMVLQRLNQYRVLLANLTGEPQTVQWPDLGGKPRGRLLTRENVEQAVTEPEAWRRRELEPLDGPLVLPAHAVACLDFVES